MGLANYLLEKAAGLKQVKRMLEAAQKSPEAAKRLAFHRKPEHWGTEGVTNYYTQHLDNSSSAEAVQSHLAQINQRLAESRNAKAKPSQEVQATNRGWANSVGHASVPATESSRRSRGLVDYQVKHFTPTAHAQDLEKFRQQTGKRWNENFGIEGVVGVYDLGASRPKAHVGISSPHTSVDSLRGETAGWQHISPDPKHPRSVRARTRQEFSKPVPEEGLGQARDVKGSPVGVHLDPRFETVVSGSYLKDKKIGEFVQIPKSRGNPLNYNLSTAIAHKDSDSTRDLIKGNLAGQSRQSTHALSEEQISSSALQQALKSKQFNRVRTAPHSAFSKPLHMASSFADNVAQYRTPSATHWPGAAYPSNPRYVGKGQNYTRGSSTREGESYWTSELIPAVPTHYAGRMDLSKGNLFYKTDNPKAFGKAMNKYLDKPIEGS